LLLTATAGARAQEQAEDPASRAREEAAAAKLKQIAEERSGHGDGDVPPADSDVDPAKGAPQPIDPPRGVVFDEETKAAYRQAWQAYYKYRVQGYEDRLQVFAWQSISTKVTFGVVVALVLAGVYFAAVQFHVGMRLFGASFTDTPMSSLTLQMSDVIVKMCVDPAKNKTPACAAEGGCHNDAYDSSLRHPGYPSCNEGPVVLRPRVAPGLLLSEIVKN
jgi:hypothetical protein